MAFRSLSEREFFSKYQTDVITFGRTSLSEATKKQKRDYDIKFYTKWYQIKREYRQHLQKRQPQITQVEV
jgi:hypothetical protein